MERVRQPSCSQSCEKELELSFNLVFHLASGLACLLLIYALIRLQSLLRFHGQLWKSLDPEYRAVLLDWPGLFIAKLAMAMGVPVLGSPTQRKPQRIEMTAWVRAHVELGILSFTWSARDQIVLMVRDARCAHEWVATLEKALGGATQVQIRPLATKSEVRSLE